MVKVRNPMLLSMVFLLCISTVSLATNERRVALVIGNSAYKNAPLRNPANDATDISRVLKRLGFQVTVLRDASQRKMEDSIRAFGKRLSKGGVGLFYYAGHGMQVDGRNYLIPVDARIEDPSDVRYEALDAGRVLGKMEVAANPLNIVILDACRDNPFSRSWRSVQKGLARMDAPKGLYISYATAPGSVAADGSGRNGTFTKSLLDHIEVPGLTLESVMKRVRKDVIEETGSKQIPWNASSITGEFFFTHENKAASQPKRAINVRKRQTLKDFNAEEEAWSIVRTSSTVEDYTMFLDEYPSSRFSGAAKLKIQQLKRAQRAKTLLASVEPTVNETKVVKEGPYTKYPNGIVYDSSTGLEWYPGPKRSLSWESAQLWVNNIKDAGGNWRMPTRNEIRSLYQQGIGNYNRTSLINTLGWYFWCAKTRFSLQDRWYFTFILGTEVKAEDLNKSLYKTIAVRKRK